VGGPVVAAPLRIAEVIGQLTIGGAELQLAELAHRLDRTRFEPVVYCLAGSGGPAVERLAADGVVVRLVGAKGPARARRLRERLQADGIALVHSWLFLANSYAWAARLLGTRAPLVTSARNCKSQGWAHHLANMAAFRASAGIVVNSEQVRAYVVRRYRADPRRITVIRNGVDTARFRPADRVATEPPTILTAGRLVAQKNPLLFVAAATALRRRVPEARFRMIGDGPLRPVVLEAVRAAGLEGAFDLPGERSDLEDCYRRAAVFWLTSDWEGLPNVVLEALASGLPVVATDVGGVRELVTSGREGFVVAPGDANAFVEASVRLLEDGEMRATLSSTARRRALEFSFEEMVRGTESVYDAVLGKEAVEKPARSIATRPAAHGGGS
jgi:glycosyltransferase involved in cell wall biosynthesis